MSLLRLFKFVLLFSLFCLTSQTHARPPIDEIVKLSAQTFSYNQKYYLALTLRHHEGWHTYWKNPGDSGLPTKVRFRLNQEELELPALEWPAPRRYIEEGDILVFGHSGDKTLFYEINPQTLQKLQKKDFEIYSNWLMCADICIPGESTLLGRFEGSQWTTTSELPFTLINDILIQRLQRLPKLVTPPIDMDFVLALDPKREEGLILYVTLPGSSKEDLIERMNLLTPFPLRPLDFRREQLYYDQQGTIYLRTPIDWDGRYQNPPMPLPADGNFATPLKLKFLFANPFNQIIEVIEKEFTSYSLAAGERLEEFHQMLTPISNENQVTEQAVTQIQETQNQEAPAQDQSLMMLLLFAFLGGLILNIMPCVLPVISLKLFGLIKHKQESPARLLTHNLSYTLGVLVTFWLLALVVIALKSAGELVGWGFQLQSPSFVAIMCIVIFILALNMFGVFEFKTPGGATLGNVKTQEGYLGDFLSGVLATILSTPCSAPFLGTALTFAFLSSNAMVFLILTAVGLGLAFPFILTGLIPKTIAFLPRPGFWMDHFKKFLGLTLVLTTLWLLDVYQALIIGSIGVLKLQTLLVLIFFAFYVWNKMSKQLGLNLPLWTFIIFLTVNIFLNIQQASPLVGDSSASTLLQEKQIGGLPWIAWSEDQMQEMAQNEELVFMDFTAKWCLTCKVNERLVIDTQRFREMMDTYDVKLLLADWTRRDKYIGDWLRSQGMVGVPAYFIQRPDGSLVKLGETITFSSLEREFKNARSR
jgi:thiol:disulfide interchange protein